MKQAELELKLSELKKTLEDIEREEWEVEGLRTIVAFAYSDLIQIWQEADRLHTLLVNPIAKNGMSAGKLRDLADWFEKSGYP